MTTRALPRSGRSEAATEADTNAEKPAASAEPVLSTEADPPASAAFSNAVVRTSRNLVASVIVTVAIALPAYIGRLKVSSLKT